MLPDQKYNYDILAIGAHPDDVEHSIGGTLIKLGDQGKSICIAHMTHGESGTYGSREKRDSEARAAAKYLKADVHWLEFEDTKIEDSLEARLKMIRFIREVRPRLIFCQYYEYPLMHRDHEATGLIVRNSFRMCRFKNIDTGNDPFWIPNIAYYLLPHHVRPTFVYDVTDVHDRHAGGDAVHDRVTHPDELVADAEVRQEGDRAGHPRTVSRAGARVERERTGRRRRGGSRDTDGWGAAAGVASGASSGARPRSSAGCSGSTGRGWSGRSDA